ncbi:hypothetical protein [Spiroplasma endosymbiont of Amphibalanus improvisus]|uniref:hypothetical protein n=1 Tax=Spiroplasma endosymbiont of Amphibalanus improvisus TaxID=3066327 RepID=UPI00313BFF6E
MPETLYLDTYGIWWSAKYLAEEVNSDDKIDYFIQGINSWIDENYKVQVEIVNLETADYFAPNGKELEGNTFQDKIQTFATTEGCTAVFDMNIAYKNENTKVDSEQISIVNDNPGITYTTDKVYSAEEGKTFYNFTDPTKPLNNLTIPDHLYIDTSAIYYTVNSLSSDEVTVDTLFCNSLSRWILHNYNAWVNILFGDLNNEPHFYDENGNELNIDNPIAYFATTEGSTAVLNMLIYYDSSDANNNREYQTTTITITNQKPGNIKTDTTVVTDTHFTNETTVLATAIPLAVISSVSAVSLALWTKKSKK